MIYRLVILLYLYRMKYALFLVWIPWCAWGQYCGPDLPRKIDARQRYAFYLHGGVVTELGNNAVNQSVPEWGPYEYLAILDSLKARQVNVISERRIKNVPDSVYIEKIVLQIDTLLRSNVKPENILVLGASAGMYIALRVAARCANKRVQYVVMGGCWPNTYKEFEDLRLSGNFLSVIEKSDPHGTCRKIFRRRKQITRFEELVLSTGLSHGFIYKGYPAWIDPVMAWWKKAEKM